ncbi:ADP-ribosylglycohydrolase family protein [Planktotalea sp.]|uniref:ADP-ribosylglycohydrolase family protein n=1 Tax=Planktotalea sp. TaxID=2029877 RepID=UPI003298DBEC
MTTQTPNTSAALMGALVADAATLGLHWIYDPDRIAKVAGNAPAFTPIDPANFEGVPAYFAHAQRRDGDLSQYGEVLLLAMRSMDEQGAFDVTAYQDAYSAFFGAGGPYNGYIDRPTRGALANIAADIRAPSGTDDDQHPAIATLPAIVAHYHGNEALPAMIQTAMQVTNVNAVADHYAAIFADLLLDVLAGTPLKTALNSAAQREPLLHAALTTSETNSTAYGQITERACHLPQGMPLSFHILNNTDSFQAAIDANILAGGDNCGRAIIIGSLAGAAYGLENIPLEWLLSMNAAQESWSLAKKI